MFGIRCFSTSYTETAISNAQKTEGSLIIYSIHTLEKMLWILLSKAVAIPEKTNPIAITSKAAAIM
ncbi:hypothetical protein VCR14J2_210084 [Vibrio coralliirubri]|nr:hypothetical protein VCR14J2_210084 [Vibrio coralliirubri]